MKIDYSELSPALLEVVRGNDTAGILVDCQTLLDAVMIRCQRAAEYHRAAGREPIDHRLDLVVQAKSLLLTVGNTL